MSERACFSIACATEWIIKLLNFCQSDGLEMLAQSSFNYISLIINEDEYLSICVEDILCLLMNCSVQDISLKISECWLKSTVILVDNSDRQ